MSKYDSSKILKKKVALNSFKCQLCKNFIKEGKDYFSEEVKDNFLHSLHKKKFCKECVEKFKKQLPPIVN